MMFRIKNAPRNALKRREFRVENYRCLCLLLIIRQWESSTMSIDALDDPMGRALPLQLSELFPIAPTIHDDSPMRRDQNALFFTLYNNVIKSNWKFQNSWSLFIIIIWLSLSLLVIIIKSGWFWPSSQLCRREVKVRLRVEIIFSSLS